MGSLFAASSGLSCSEQSMADATCRDCYPETFGDIQQPLPPSPKFRRVRVWLIEFDRDDFHHIFNALLVLGGQGLNLFGVQKFLQGRSKSIATTHGGLLRVANSALKNGAWTV